jgi:hypothetical protein
LFGGFVSGKEFQSTTFDSKFKGLQVAVQHNLQMDSQRALNPLELRVVALPSDD